MESLCLPFLNLRNSQTSGIEAKSHSEVGTRVPLNLAHPVCLRVTSSNTCGAASKHILANTHFLANTHSSELPIRLFLPTSSAETQSEKLKYNSECTTGGNVGTGGAAQSDTRGWSSQESLTITSPKTLLSQEHINSL